MVPCRASTVCLPTIGPQERHDQTLLCPTEGRGEDAVGSGVHQNAQLAAKADCAHLFSSWLICLRCTSHCAESLEFLSTSSSSLPTDGPDMVFYEPGICVTHPETPSNSERPQRPLTKTHESASRTASSASSAQHLERLKPSGIKEFRSGLHPTTMAHHREQRQA